MSSKSIYPVNDLSFRVGRVFRRERRANDLTQSELAQKIGIKIPAAISLLEQGRIWCYERHYVPTNVSLAVTKSGYIHADVLAAIESRLKRVAAARAALDEAIADLENIQGLEQWL